MDALSRPRLNLSALCTALLLAGCGGGGEGDGSGSPASASAGAQAVAAGAASPTAVSSCGLPDFAATALARINQYRAAGASCRTRGTFAAAAPLAWHEALAQAADGHARDMAANRYFSHTSLDGRTVAQRVDAAGYLWRALGENIAAGQRTVNDVVDGWMASDGHCANLMNAAYTQVGLACAPGTDYPTYWTLDLAAPRGG